MLGSLEAGLRGVLVAGTNGKGSVQAMVGAVLAEGGLLVGQTPKPHLVDYRERIVIGGRPMAPDDFAESCAPPWRRAMSWLVGWGRRPSSRS